ncbi:MAG: transposase [Candidatus Thiodiazotropha sp. (ex Lucinoma aequizonata)]|nr:transposase [Candidatus Thiodiazotropha sp. (ex Lucinoma aequizonata)]MCU7888682.1 transposase [Candidatus Thiodiazotropha sp. (ex Lucinoma aequizonata)]MCU7895959.1 transposase [Candidatus Thiodiazotropha sp. (ex Lucinoma aequizonata)]MCU7900541.1 transposase [Candidatus Thiodiazotropha sp. (ex Lucinoma aequizonata)]MCU7904157.1 transposase [Candidatus Thiodiazotropha sp. (ex Lucinoma aequizonata)]
MDDSIKTRCGKKMKGVSSYFDHVTGRHVMGQQVLTLGLATEEAFLPLNPLGFYSPQLAANIGE